MLLAHPDELTRHLAKARATKLPLTVREILETGDDHTVAVMVQFADGTSGAGLLPLDMLSEANVRVTAAAVAMIWEWLRPPAVYRGKGKDDDEVIELDGCRQEPG